jgi:hypothetical protein
MKSPLGLLFGLIAFVSASATPMMGTISGTCGFFNLTNSDVVYSQNFSGDGTFCTGFPNGGSFTNLGVLQAGDLTALAHNNIEAISPSGWDATAPAGYGVFVDFQATYSVTEEYLVTPTAPTTPTGFLETIFSVHGSPDDGTGIGGCSTRVSVTLGGLPNPASVAITFGEPVEAVETATINCAVNSGTGPGFGNFGDAQISSTPYGVEDANGNRIGSTLTETVVSPEPSTTVPLLALTGVALIYLRKRV